MAESLVACRKVGDSVTEAVSDVMNKANWQKHITGKNIVLKVNVVWDKLYPGCTTTPMVIEGVLKEISGLGANVTIADTNTAAGMYAERSFEVQGIKKLAKKYGATCTCLTYDKFEEVKFDGIVIDKFKVSHTILNADTIITMPIPKMHQITKMTAAIKNQWGCIHDLRHNLHPVVNEALADVNKFLKSRIKFSVMDALFSMGGKGPKSGEPVEVGYVLASNDLVSLDCVAAGILGWDPKEVEHIVLANKVGVGSMDYKLIGDKPPALNLEKPGKKNLVIGSEFLFRGTPLEWFVFKSPFFNVCRKAAQVYYDVWYAAGGNKNTEKMMNTRFGKMWQAYLDKPWSIENG